ncbi:peroxide stress protein YaaA [Noviherbaspirillum sp.]|uniref:peroxide stress protein YaaA n=1 Tax=Noviherbaspirillum sp. TaxID=1926288 RepID=UPI002FE3696B
MLIVLSPAKTLDFETPPVTDLHTRPDFIEHSAQLIDILKTKAPAEIASLMGISDALAALNAERFAAWSKRRFTTASAKQAMFAFNGDVYDGLNAKSLTARQIDYAQSHLRILSGLYGVLRPLDLMQPYRLEMGTRLENPRGKDLYAFWGELVTAALNAELSRQSSTILVNLASDEYFKSVKPKLLHARIVTPVFEDWKNGRYKIISFFAKRARGLMARYAIAKGLRQVEKLKGFDSDGYAFDAAASTDDMWVFRRRL